jgi:two-component system nitrogen regulation sensor histidine kinase NtrY
MSFRTKLMLSFGVTVAVAVGLVAWAVSETTRRAFEELDSQRTAALVAQFRKEFERRGEEIVHRVRGIAEAEGTVRMAMMLSRPEPDYSLYVHDAAALASAQGLDFVDIVAADGTIVSSAHWPARFGYRNEWVTAPVEWSSRGSFLKRVEQPEGTAVALLAVEVILVGEERVYIIGGQQLGSNFLASLVLPAGMRALLYLNLEEKFSAHLLTDASGRVEGAEKLSEFVEQVRREPREASATLAWSAGRGGDETFHAIPLAGLEVQPGPSPHIESPLLGILLVGSSRRELAALEDYIRMLALLVGGGGILLGMLLSWWAAARVTRPVEELVRGAGAVAAGNWDARVSVSGGGEIGRLAESFNQMTAHLAEQRERLLQAERVAAWRELARRLAHELKNPLFPLQITVENLQKAREGHPREFDEVFREGTATLLSELRDLRAIVDRFSDFARMPRPEFQSVNLNELVRETLKLFEAQFSAVGRPPIVPELRLGEPEPVLEADPELLRRVLQNLVLNAMDAMPAGGSLTLRTAKHNGTVLLEVADTGAGLTREECERLFTPYYTMKRHGTGLGLAIVQSVVSDHGGRIHVESEPGAGTTFRIELPEHRPRAEASQESGIGSRE